MVREDGFKDVENKKRPVLVRDCLHQEGVTIVGLGLYSKGEPAKRLKY